jgi:hypothetical protein
MLQIHWYAQLPHGAVVALTTVEGRCEKGPRFSWASLLAIRTSTADCPDDDTAIMEKFMQKISTLYASRDIPFECDDFHSSIAALIVSKSPHVNYSNIIVVSVWVPRPCVCGKDFVGDLN